MKGYIYIASAFETVNRTTCGQKGAGIDNDPHFWTSPPTWGICRNDLRATAEVGDFVFFVLPRHGKHPQTIFAFLKIAEKIPHAEAYFRTNLGSKRMGNKIPNGNIIVDERGRYNRFDAGVHRHMFERVNRHYVIGDESESRMLSPAEISTLAPKFLGKLRTVLRGSGDRPIDLICRKGRKLDSMQVRRLLAWLDDR